MIDLWAVDAAGLDVYQFRILVHIGRVGICWKSVRTLSEDCNMSMGKVSEVKRWLEVNGHIEPAVDPKSNNMGYRVTAKYERSQGEQLQPNCSPHEQERSLSEQERSPHERKTITISKKHNTYIHPDPDPIAAIKTALSKTTKTPLWAENEESYDKAAYMIFGWDCSGDDVEAFGKWWQIAPNGHYPGKPALKSLVTEFPNFIAQRQAKQNGHAPIPDDGLAELMAKMEYDNAD